MIATTPLTIADLPLLRRPSDPQLSPDGTRVAFVVTVADIDADRPVSRIWVVAAAGTGEPRPVTSGPGDRDPRWSPDGESLLYVTDGGASICRLSTAVGEPLVVARGRGIGELACSPDGAWIAFTAASDILGVDDDQPVVIDRLGPVGGLRRHLYTVAADGGEPRPLTWGDSIESQPAWSPESERLAFVSDRGDERDVQTTSSMCTVSRSGGHVDVVTSGSVDLSPIWLPDGDTLVFARRVGIRVGLFRASTAGGEPIEVAGLAALDRSVRPFGGLTYPGAPPRYDAESDSALVCLHDAGSTHLHRVPVDGGAPKRIAGDADHCVTGVSTPQSGRVALVVASPTSIGDVLVDDTVVASFRLDGREVVRPEPRMFTAPDAKKVGGWVIRPPDAAGPGPLLLDIHGGPHGSWGPALTEESLWHQELVSRGWTVLLVNPRGSDGYGADFLGAVTGSWGRADAGDLLAAVDELVADGVAEPDRLAVAGYSYGGYMTCWLTTVTDRFAAAVAGGCLSNLVSASGTMVNPGFLAGVEFDDRPGDMSSALADSSPITHVDAVRTPTLLLHGEADELCPIGQAEEWFTALRTRRVPARMVRYPGAFHLFPLAGRPSHRADFARRLVDWATEHTPSRSGQDTAAPR